MFFSTVKLAIEYWYLLLYVLLTATTVFNFQRRVVMQTRPYQRVRYHLIDRWAARPPRQVGTLVLRLLVLPFIALALFPFALVLWFVLGHLDAEERKRQAEAEARLQEVYRTKAQYERSQRDAENRRRAEARKKWLTENKFKLYYNTVNGVTAVLRPADYASAQARTARARRNGTWEKDNVLLPQWETVVFATQQGRELIDANTGSDYIRRYKVAGWPAELDDIVKQGKVELIRADDIFVPWVNETLVSFKQQERLLHDCVNYGKYCNLVEMQIPKELQPVS